MKRVIPWLVSILLMLILVACAQSTRTQGGSDLVTRFAITPPASSGTPTPKWTVAPITQTQPSIGKETPVMNVVPIATPFDPGLQKIIAQAQADLAQRLAIPVDQVEFVEAQSVTWPDNSLGCPQPGMAYLQVQVDGLLIRLRATDRLYEYHGGGNRPPFLCETTP
jgi:hypothetical protein